MLVHTLLLASVTSLAGGVPAARGALPVGPMWAAYVLAVHQPWHVLELATACGAPGEVPCDELPGPDIDDALPALGNADGEVHLPSVSDEMGGTLGGFVNVDLMKALHLSAGPELSWLTPDSPREDLLRLRVVAPGWGVRYTWDVISVGVAVCTRFVMLGEEDFPVVDMLTSEARIELLLP